MREHISTLAGYSDKRNFFNVKNIFGFIQPYYQCYICRDIGKAQVVIKFESTVWCHSLHDALLKFKTIVKLQNSVVELSLCCPFYKTKFLNFFYTDVHCTIQFLHAMSMHGYICQQ